jgi:CRISPR-associated protein Csb2
MFAIRVECLTGRYACQAYDDRDRAEWPPHPARLFSALVATWAETDGDLEERAALEFLETCAAPAIDADGPDEIGRRKVVPHFVPVNDVSVLGGIAIDKLEVAEAELAAAPDDAKRKKAQAALDKAHKKHVDDCAKAIAVGKDSKDARKTALHVLPQSRLLQPRTFPSIGLTRPEVSFVFAEDPGMRRDALDRLCRRLVRLGHPSSLVSARVEDTTATPAWHPSDEGDTVLRWVESGQLARLEEAWPRHEGVAPRVLPAVFVRYTFGEAEATEEVPGSVFADDPVVLVLTGGARVLPITAAADLAGAVRGALMVHADQPPAEILSGHRADDTPSMRPHLAIAPLPHVGNRYADGRVLGVALVLPRDASDTERRAVYTAVGRWMGAGGDLRMGALGRFTVEPDEGGDTRKALQPSTWSEPSRLWASATPVALDRNPGDLLAGGVAQQEAHRAAEESIALACERVGLPRPVSVEVSFRPPWEGAAKVDARHPPFPRKQGRLRRVQVHARVAFAEPVRGPVLLGAGRYVGLGLLKPVRGGE